MRIRPGEENAYTEFAAEQSASGSGQMMLEFMETWSSMMEYALDQGVGDTSEIASITVQAAADEAGVTEDSVVVDGGSHLLQFWAHGEGLKEWLGYRPPEGILNGLSTASMDVWYASQELLDVLPDMVEAYPSILQSAPDILTVRKARMDSSMSDDYPSMTM